MVMPMSRGTTDAASNAQSGHWRSSTHVQFLLSGLIIGTSMFHYVLNSHKSRETTITG